MEDESQLYFFFHHLVRTFRVFDQNHQLCLLELKVASTNGVWRTFSQVTYYLQSYGT